jgi:hypothetical protein
MRRRSWVRVWAARSIMNSTSRPGIITRNSQLIAQPPAAWGCDVVGLPHGADGAVVVPMRYAFPFSASTLRRTVKALDVITLSKILLRDHQCALIHCQQVRARRVKTARQLKL